MIFLQVGTNVGGLSEASVRAAYGAIVGSGITHWLIGIASVVALIIMVKKVLSIYLKAVKDKENYNAKAILELVKQYAKYAVFIVVFPFIMVFIEGMLASVQDNVISSYNSSLERNGLDVLGEYVDDYAEEIYDDFTTDEDEGLIASTLKPFTGFFKGIFDTIAMAIRMAALYVMKYVYFIFCAIRYLWLAMLQVLAPLAIVLSIDKETRSYFYSWLKNMIICYLLVPFYLMANVFSEAIINVIAKSVDMSAYGFFMILLMVVIKVTLFGAVSKKSMNLI